MSQKKTIFGQHKKYGLFFDIVFCGDYFCAKPRGAVVTKAQSDLVVHYSLNFTAYKAASRGSFLRCGTLSCEVKGIVYH